MSETSQEKINRGLRIKNIRENELHYSKARLARSLGISGQFLGLVEDGKGNLMYNSLKKLCEISGHSADYILFGLDDNIISKTKELLQSYSDFDIINALNIIRGVSLFIKNRT